MGDDFNLNTSRSETVEKKLQIRKKKKKGNSSSTSQKIKKIIRIKI